MLREVARVNLNAFDAKERQKPWSLEFPANLTLACYFSYRAFIGGDNVVQESIRFVVTTLSG